jgi:phosphoribosylanthranilate isomerase
MAINFVAISGVSTSEQLKGISKICNEKEINFPVAIGYQFSSKSINQGSRNQRQPIFADFGELNKQTLEYGFIPAVHYHTTDNETILGDLEQITNQGLDPNLALVQFNTSPPTIDTLRKVKEMGFRIIFPVSVSNKQSPEGGFSVWKGEGIQDVTQGETDPLIEEVLERKDVIDYIMFDPSHGTNLELDLNEQSLAIRFGQEIMERQELNYLDLVYAGGINPTNVGHLVGSLMSYFPKERISVDIESGVMMDNRFDLDLVRSYLIGCRDNF